MATSKVQKARIANKDNEAMGIMEIYEQAYLDSLSDLQRLENLQMQYDNVTEDSAWPTISKIPIPIMFSMVEKALPDVIEYLFPHSSFVRLMPLEAGVDMESVRKTETALQTTMIHRMKLQHNSFATIKDCFKLGIGYGIVEPCTVTPPTVVKNLIVKDGKTVKSTRELRVGSALVTTRYRYVSPAQIIVTQDGSSFNGTNKVTWSFFLDTYNETDFANLFNDQPKDGENVLLKGNPDEIIKEARDMGFQSNTSIVDFVAALAGIDLSKQNKRYGKSVELPVRIPVLKGYSAGRHVWIANGTRIIFDQKDKYQTMRCPLIRCSAWPDGMRWYPMSTPEAAEKMSLGINLWVNALYDLMTYRIKPTALYNKRVIDKPPERGPQGDVAVDGNVDQAFAYANVPPMDNGLFQIGQIMQQWYGDATGQNAATTNPQAGMLRGGVYAFESLLQSTTGRSRLAGAILETGFLEDVAMQTLINMQMNIPEGGDVFRLRKYSPTKGNEYIEEMRITENDLVNAYDLTLNLRSKARNSMVDSNKKMSEWNAYKDSEFIDKYEFLISRFDEEEEALRFVLPKEKVKKMQDEDRQAGLAERKAGIQKAVASAQASQASAQPTGPEAVAGGQTQALPQM